MSTAGTRNHPVPKVGDTVVLNAYGQEQTGLRHSVIRTLKMKVTWVHGKSMTDDIPTYILAVDDPEIDQLMLTHHDFDIVERAQ